MKRVILIMIAALMVPYVACAQTLAPQTGYTIITPGQTPTFVHPNLNGSYTAITPGQPPTFINRNLNGSYTVITPGEKPTFINPTNPAAPGFQFGGANGNQ